MKKSLPLLVSLFLVVAAQKNAGAQVYWKDVAQIFYTHCTTCHRPGEIGEDYLNATGYSALTNSPFFYSIPVQTESGLMPPWKADPDYRHFLDERILTATEKDLISQWIDEGALPGDTTLAPPPPVFPTGSQLGIPNLTLTMSESYTIPGDDSDHYMCFVLPTNLMLDQNVSAIEFRPGNAAVVHHAFIYLSDDSSAVYADAATPEYGYPSFGDAGNGVSADFISLYGPGMTPRFYPPHSGINFKANSFVIIQVHYAPINYVATDQSSVNLFFTFESNIRDVHAKRIGEGYITNQPFTINANEVDTFYSEYPVNTDFSLFAMAPHQHLLGKSYKIWAVTADFDTIPLINIPQWDFHWQMLYSYPFMIKLPENSVVHARAIYDNTIYNPNNPHNPPENVHYGESSEDEMFKYFLNTLDYEPGDEDIVLDSSWIATGAPITGIVGTAQFYGCSPNPAKEAASLSYYLPEPASAFFYVYDVSGKLVKEVPQLNLVAGFHQLKLNTVDYQPGIYFCTMKSGNKVITKRLIIQQ